MVGSYVGTYQAAVTLSTATPDVTFGSAAVVAADSLLGTYGVPSVGGVTLKPFYGPVLGPAGANFTITNLGLIENTGTAAYSTGIFLDGGGVVTNAGTILGGPDGGVFMETAGTVRNSGVINDGTLNGDGGVTVLRSAGAYVENAASASIYGAFGLYLGYGAATVMNAGNITGRYIGMFGMGEGISLTNLGTIADGKNPLDAIAIDGSADITNGAVNDTTAAISGNILFSTSSTGANGAPTSLASTGTVTNFGTMGGVSMQTGTVKNGSESDTKALISGEAIFTTGGVLKNFGTVSSLKGNEVNLGSGGTLINGSAADETALLTGVSLNLGISLGKNTSFVNYGVVNGGTITGVYEQSGVIVNELGGTITGDSHSVGVSAALLVGAYGNATVTNAGLIEGITAFSGYFPHYVYNNTLVNSGSIVSSLGTAGVAVKMGKGNNLLVDRPGAVFVGTVAGGAGSDRLELARSDVVGTLGGFGSQFVQFGTLTIDSGAAWEIEGGAGGFGATTIAGFSTLDSILLEGTTFTQAQASFANGIGLVLQNSSQSVTLDIAGSFSTGDFALHTVAAGTEITLAAPCFCRGTRIRTPGGDIPVEQLRTGDLVLTAAGPKPVRWIGRRAYDGRFIAGSPLMLPVRIRRHALGRNLPSRDLFVSPGHAMVLEGQLVHAWRLLNGVSIAQLREVASVEYFHLDFGTHEVIFAENAPTESFRDIGCRNQFHNAASYDGPPVPPPHCLPVLEQGYALAALQARLAARAGIAPGPRHVPGALIGYIDALTPMLSGWAMDEAAPEAAVELEVLCRGRIATRILANLYRADVHAAGFGNGCHGFSLPLAELGTVSGPLRVRRASDQAALPLAATALRA